MVSPKKKSIVIKILIGLGLMCFLTGVFLVAVFLWWCHSMGQPSTFGLNVSKDQELVTIYYAHKQAFEKLQQMATDDAQYGWSFNSPDFEGAKLDEKYRQEYEKDPRYAWYFKSPYFEGGKLKEARLKEYKDLVSEVSPGLDIGMDYNGTMRFIFAGGGTSAIGPGWAKGIEYVPGSHEINRAVYCGEWKLDDVTNSPQWQGLLLTNLDNAQSLPANVYMRPIETNWFLFYQRGE